MTNHVRHRAVLVFDARVPLIGSVRIRTEAVSRGKSPPSLHPHRYDTRP
ncbi:hypothetical protein BQ8420_13580 [Nocardiopsis sp. JB363]|nr:hypothetical protein BQ8420_13580 [Nocardiopsis sp. JB363]